MTDTAYYEPNSNTVYVDSGAGHVFSVGAGDLSDATELLASNGWHIDADDWFFSDHQWSAPVIKLT